MSVSKTTGGRFSEIIKPYSDMTSKGMCRTPFHQFVLGLIRKLVNILAIPIESPTRLVTLSVTILTFRIIESEQSHVNRRH